MDVRSMDTAIRCSVNAAGKDAQYDERAKRLLGNKYILAHILVKTVDVFYGMKPEGVVPYIEGEPYIGVVPVEPGLTNHAKGSGQKVTGLNSENAEINEGLIRFDIVFYVRMPSTGGSNNGLSQIIVNVEAQKDAPAEYKILNRAIFYVSRLVSSQKERDFINTNYDEIKRVFSIWICMNMSQDSMNYVHLTNESVIGSYEWKGKLDLLNIVLIGLSNELPEYNEKYELHRLLGTLLSKRLSPEEKLSIIETEYSIPVEESIRKDVSVMCNLSQGIREEGRAEGRAEGEIRIILNMYKKGFSPEQIASAVDKKIDEVQAIIAGKEPSAV